MIVAALETAEHAFDRGVGIKLPIRGGKVVDESLVTPSVADVRPRIEPGPRRDDRDRLRFDEYRHIGRRRGIGRQARNGRHWQQS